MATNKIKLNGWFSGETLGGTFKIFRGYADLKVLAKISIPFKYRAGENTGYQREKIESHAKDIKDYFEKSGEGYKFIPEIILGVRLDPEEKVVSLSAGFSDDERRLLLTPEIASVITTNNNQSNKPAIKIGKKATITINLNELENKKETIRRVDGNHRLFYANELIEDSSNPNKYIVPFCMILLGSTENKWDDYAEARIFYNINQKGVPITSEHGFNVLLTSDIYESKLFDNDPILFCAKYFKDRIDESSIEFKKIFGNEPLTNIYNLMKVLKEQNIIKFEQKEAVESFLEKNFHKINQYYLWALTEKLKISESFKIIPAILLILHDDKKDNIKYWLRNYNEWIIQNNLLEDFESMKPSEIWVIFKKWKENQPKTIFVACSFKDTKKFEAIRDMIKEAINKVKGEHPDLNIEHIRIDENRGETFELPSEIFHQIDNSGLVIADLTDERPNVYCEVGYAKARGIPFILTYMQKDETDGKEKNKIHADLRNYKYVPYETEVTLRNELIKELKGFYGKS